MKKLAAFSIEIKGKYTFLTSTDYDGKNYRHPEFYELSAYEVIDEKEVPYHPSGVSWAGKAYDEDDMIQGFIFCLICNCKQYEKIYLDQRLQKFVDSFHSKRKIVTVENGLDIPKRIVQGTMIYELDLVTDKYIYYVWYEDFLMLDTQTHEVVSDNFFASVGYEQSLEAIQNGEETVIWKHKE